jgi:hypothetical protein
MQELMQGIDAELRDAGELVASVGLVDPDRATTVRLDGGVPIATDGPFAESLRGRGHVELTDPPLMPVCVMVNPLPG